MRTTSTTVVRVNAHRLIRALSTICLGACFGCASAVPRVPVYPPLAARTDRPLGVRFEPSAGVIAVPLACAHEELPDNGIDDDCDGRVDARPDAGPYLALAHAADLAVEVRLRAGSGALIATFVSGDGHACGASDVAKPHVDAFFLESGSYELVANLTAACTRSVEGALSVSLGQGRTRQVFASGGLTNTPQVLGRVIVEVQTISSSDTQTVTK